MAQTALQKIESTLHDVNESLAEQDQALVYMHNYLVKLNQIPENREVVNYLWEYLRLARKERNSLCTNIGQMYSDIKEALFDGTTRL